MTKTKVQEITMTNQPATNVPKTKKATTSSFERVVAKMKKEKKATSKSIPEYEPTNKDERKLFSDIFQIREKIKELYGELNILEPKAIEKVESIWKDEISKDIRVNSIRVVLPDGFLLFSFKNQEAKVTNPDLAKLKLKKHFNDLVTTKRVFKIKEGKAEELFELLGAETFMEYFEVEEQLVTVPDFRKRTAMLGIDCSDCVQLAKPSIKVEPKIE